MRIIADRESCIGSGQCSLTEPAVFDLDDEDGRVRLLREQPEPGFADETRQAVLGCPVRALTLNED